MLWTEYTVIQRISPFPIIQLFDNYNWYVFLGAILILYQFI